MEALENAMIVIGETVSTEAALVTPLDMIVEPWDEGWVDIRVPDYPGLRTDVLVDRVAFGPDVPGYEFLVGESDEDKRVLKELQKIPNIGPAMAMDLLRLGIRSKDQLVGQSADELYQALCTLDNTRHDPCVHDVFAAAIAYANGEPARPWWEFSRERKQRMKDITEQKQGDS